MNRIRQFLADQRGAAMIMVAVAMIMIFGFAVLSIDVGTMAVVKGQLQDGADAAALAAAQSYVQSGGNDTLAVRRAIEFAAKNRAIINAGAAGFNKVDSIIIRPSDVTFPQAGRVKVVTHRTVATGDPFRTYFMRVLDPALGNGQMTAHATASFSWVTCTDCLRPWAPPDRWFDANGDSLYNPDPVTNPTEYYDPITTGYTDADLGHQITLYLGNSNSDNFGSSWYYPVDFPPINQCGSAGNCPVTGGSAYNAWISGCTDNTFTVGPGDSLMVENGAKVGPTQHGLDSLIALDLGAHWNSTTGEVNGSAYDVSPRIIKTACFDPSLGVQKDSNGKGYLTVVKIIVLFIEQSSGHGGTVTGRFMRLNSSNGVNCNSQGGPTFLYRTALTE